MNTDGYKYAGAVELIQIIFIALKLSGRLLGRWIWIFAPSWISLLIIALIMIAREVIEYYQSLWRELPRGIRIVSDSGASVKVEESRLNGSAFFPLTCMTDRKNRRYIRIKGRRYYI